MKTIAFWNRKSAAGKTATAGNVAAALYGGAIVLTVDSEYRSIQSGARA